MSADSWTKKITPKHRRHLLEIEQRGRWTWRPPCPGYQQCCSGPTYWPWRSFSCASAKMNVFLFLLNSFYKGIFSIWLHFPWNDVLGGIWEYSIPNDQYPNVCVCVCVCVCVYVFLRVKSLGLFSQNVLFFLEVFSGWVWLAEMKKTRQGRRQKVAARGNSRRGWA